MKSQLPFGSIPKGTTVQFSVTQGMKGPEAVNIQPMDNYHSGPSMQKGGMWPGGGPMQSMPTGGVGLVGKPNKVYYGTIKTFNEVRGWGHITCVETQQAYG